MLIFGVALVPLLVGVIGVFVLGGLWYSILFGKPWSEAIKGDALNRLPAVVVYGSTLVINLLTAWLFGYLLATPIADGMALAAGLLSGVAFGGFTLTIHYLGAGRRLTLLLYDGLFQIARFSLFGLAFQLFK